MPLLRISKHHLCIRTWRLPVTTTESVCWSHYHQMLIKFWESRQQQCVCVLSNLTFPPAPQFRSIQAVINDRKSEERAGSLLKDQMASLLFYLLILPKNTKLKVPFCQVNVFPLLTGFPDLPRFRCPFSFLGTPAALCIDTDTRVTHRSINLLTCSSSHVMG